MKDLGISISGYQRNWPAPESGHKSECRDIDALDNRRVHKVPVPPSTRVLEYYNIRQPPLSNLTLSPGACPKSNHLQGSCRSVVVVDRYKEGHEKLLDHPRNTNAEHEEVRRGSLLGEKASYKSVTLFITEILNFNVYYSDAGGLSCPNSRFRAL